MKLFDFITNLFTHPAEHIPDNEESINKSYRIVYHEGRYYPQYRKKSGSWSNYTNIITRGDCHCNTEESARMIIVNSKEEDRKLAIPNHVVGGYK